MGIKSVTLFFTLPVGALQTEECGPIARSLFWRSRDQATSGGFAATSAAFPGVLGPWFPGFWVAPRVTSLPLSGFRIPGWAAR